METMKISVIIPTYKPGKYLFENLDRLGQQTLDKNLFEIVIILNGEREPYFSQIDAYARQHPELCIRLFYTDKQGVSNARSVGIDEARGAFIAFFDDDDWASPDYLESLLSLTDGNTVVVSNVKLIEDGTRHQLSYYTTDAFNRLERKKHPSIFQARSFLSAVWGKLIPRQVIAEDRFHDNYVLGEDALFMFLISSRISDIKLASHDITYYVRYRQSSASRRHHSYWKRAKVALEVSAKYTSLYFSAPGKYDFLLYLSRVVATLKKLLQKSYEVTPKRIGVHTEG